MKSKYGNVGTAVAALMTLSVPALAQDIDTGSGGSLTANAAFSNNYIWRGLTQTMNEPAISGGVDYAADNGFYVGTWASNVSYAPSDEFSYEHDLYFGYSGGSNNFTYDFGYLYYNYDDIAEFDFGEVYATLGFGPFSVSAFVLANTEADEAPGQDFGFGQAHYLSFDYAVPLRNDLELGLHVGRHDGDFSEAFNGVPGKYVDYSISLAKGGFSFTISDTDLDSEVADGLDNGSVKFVVGYAMDFDL